MKRRLFRFRDCGKRIQEFFVEKDVKISPPSPAIFKIENIEKKMYITDARIPGRLFLTPIFGKM